MPDFQNTDLATAQQLLADLPGSLGRDRVAPVYADGVLIETLRDAIASTDFQAGQRQSQGSRFWATPSRPQQDTPIRDVFEVDLSVARLTNQIAFDLAHFPHRAVVEYSVTGTSTWQPLLDANGVAIVIETFDSNPPILSQNINQSLAHPQHFGAGHWVSHDIKTQPVQASRFRVVLTRPNGGLPPTDTQGNPVPYSLGVRAFVVGYEVESRFDIPTRSLLAGSQTVHAPIEVTRDLLGSTISYAERENPAANLITGGIWRSEPQPLPYAVVNLYLDVRDASHNPTVIERFFIDPITSGCAVNLYYTLAGPDLTAEDPWAFVEWTPVARDFAVRRGFMRFDPTRAAYFKFEFTDLAPEPYDAINALVRRVNLFPANLESTDPISRSGNTGGDGTVVNGALDGILRYEDNERLVTAGLTDLSRGFSPTEVFYSKDPAAAARLKDLSEFYNFTPWQGGTQIPHWPGTQIHPYVQAEVLHDQRVAFYVALANVTAYRLNYGFNEDTDQYLDYFLDDSAFSLNTGWVLTPQDLVTPHDGGPFTVVSKILPSRSNVRGIQYATTQSPPLQLLPDDDFNSGAMGQTALEVNWAAFGEGEAPATFAPTNDYNTDIGTTVIVTRAGTTETQPVPANHNTYTAIGQQYGTYAVIQGSGLTYADLGRTTTPQQDAQIGGIYNKQRITPAPGSRVYAAARVISKIDLGNPLYVQIYDSLSSTVVAEAPAVVTANKVVEWDVSYDASTSVTQPAAKTWDEVVSDYPTYSAMEDLSWSTIGTRPGAATPVSLIVRLGQKGLPNASWYTDTLSLFEESILWEFSNDGGETWFPAPGIRNNPRGALLFPAPNDTSLVNTYDSIAGRSPHPTYDNLSADTYADLEHAQRTLAPDRSRLCWRVTCGRGGQHVNALSIRPWYVNSGRGILAHEGVDIAGPNQALYDHYQPIAFDPRYRMWNKPIPQAWYFFYRQFTLLRNDDFVPTEVRSNTVLPEAFVVPHTAVVRSTDTLNDALVIPVGGATPPPPPAPPVEVLVEAFIYRSP
jgi:hypothetical protein